MKRHAGRKRHEGLVRENNGRVSRRYFSGGLEIDDNYKKTVLFGDMSINVKRVVKGVILIGDREFPAYISLPKLKFCEV